METAIQTTLRERCGESAERRYRVEERRSLEGAAEYEKLGERYKKDAERERQHGDYCREVAEALEFYARGGCYDARDPMMAQLVAEAEATGWPDAYVADLFYHDRRTLLLFVERQQEIGIRPAFVWVLRDCGTHVMDAYGKDAVLLTKSSARMSESSKVYVFEDGRLRETTVEGAMGMIERTQNADKQRTRKAREWREMPPY
jgi:hypothetical protein